MKQKAIYFLLIILISVTFISCSDKQANSITITNNAALGVQLNFRGTLTDIIAPGGSVVLSDILPGK